MRIRLFFILTLILFLQLFNTAYAAPVLRGGLRGGSIAFGLEEHKHSRTEWIMGYGGAFTTGANTVLGYLSFNKIIGGPAKAPLYLSLGPALGLGKEFNIGGFAHLGFEDILDSPGLFAEIGIDIMFPKGTGLSLELGYKF